MPRRSTRQNGGVEVEDIPLDNSTLNGDLEPVKGDMKTPTKMNGTPRSVKKQKKDIKDVILKDRLKELNDSTHMDGNIQDKVEEKLKIKEETKSLLPVNASTSNIDPLEKTETTEEIRSNSLAVLLSQGLTSGDAEKIDAVLSKTDAHIITTTLSELPKTQIIPLLKQIEFRFRNRKTLDIRCWARWVQYTVSIHATYLSTIGCLENELSTLYSWMRTRCAHVGSLYETHGKLMLMVEQIERRANPNFFVFQQPMAFFNEDETASENSEDSEEIEENESVPSDEDWWDDEDIASEHNDMPSDKESSSSDEEEESDNDEDQESSEEDVGEMMKRQEGSDNEMDVE